jgi:hypothetical protein
MLNLNTFHTHVGLVPGNVCINMTANACLLITFLKSILFGAQKKITKPKKSLKLELIIVLLQNLLVYIFFGYIVKHNLLIWMPIL